MSDQARTEPSCGPWYPQRKWWRPSRPFHQDVGLPPLLEPGEPWWMSVDWLQTSLAAWPAYAAAPLFVPHISGSMPHPGQKRSQEPSTWRVSLDVAHFSPAELSLSVRDGFLEVGGRHEERRDEHGSIARCFTRKYRLPAEIDATQITSTLSVDGILTVEAPVPETALPAAISIPIKVEVEAAEEEKEKHQEEEAPGTEADSSREPEAPVFLTAPDPSEEEDSPAEARGDQADPGSATAGPQQHDERREQEEETHETEADTSREPETSEFLAAPDPAEKEDSLAEVQADPGSAKAGPQQHDERREQVEETHETEADTSREPETSEALAAPDPAEEKEDSLAEVQADPGSATAGPQQHEERREQEEETHEQPAGESHPSVSADGSGTESLQDSSKQDEALGSQEGPGTDESKQPEHKDPAVGEEIQVMPGSAEQITQPEEPELGTSPLSEVLSQDPEAPDTKPEHTD